MINSSRAQFSALGWAALELGENKRFPLVTDEQQGRGCGVEPNLNGPTNNFDFQFAKTTPTSGRHILAYSDEPAREPRSTAGFATQMTTRSNVIQLTRLSDFCLFFSPSTFVSPLCIPHIQMPLAFTKSIFQK
ncbi:hypothetical protein T07_9230 [Trichinella nelsoni]|uniref:Uncharacterized protein n=1 Tax=Trichinella nelsoni TaxID=6336 RepID=A0A0V0S240_9BILA|nr:hypothetical protein T07_9230 [Trichinella nelsoni]